MRRSVIKLSRRHEWTIYLVIALVFLSGAIWALLDFFAGDANTKSLLLKIHGAAAMATLILIGTLLPFHAKFAWRAKRNRRTGSTLFGIFGFLIVTGYGLYYLGDERLRAWTSNSHSYVGLALPLLLALHAWRGKKSRPTKP